MHGDDDAGSTNDKKQTMAIRALSRLDMEFDPVLAKYYALGVLGIFLLAFVFGCLPMYDIFRSFVGTLGLFLIAFPLALFGYHALRDREQLFSFTGEELYRRAGLVAAGYVTLWLVLEFVLATTRADIYVSWFYFTLCAGLATLLAVPILAMKIHEALLHYCLFGFSVILFRFLLGFGWFWESSELIRHTNAPPPPLLPGM